MNHAWLKAMAIGEVWEFLTNLHLKLIKVTNLLQLTNFHLKGFELLKHVSRINVLVTARVPKLAKLVECIELAGLGMPLCACFHRTMH